MKASNFSVDVTTANILNDTKGAFMKRLVLTGLTVVALAAFASFLYIQLHAADNGTYSEISAFVMGSDGNLAQFKIFPNEKGNKGIMFYAPTSREADAKLMVSQIDLYVDDNPGLGYFTIDAKDALDGGCGIVIDKDFYYQAINGKRLNVRINTADKPQISYDLMLADFNLAQVRGLAKAVEGESRK